MTRDSVLGQIVTLILAVDRPHPTRVAIDGVSASGKTSLGDELQPLIEALGRPVLRASLDNFKRPWSERYLYDRESGEGYYRNAYDNDLIRTALVEPLGPDGDRRYRLASINPVTQRADEEVAGTAAADAVLLADGVFALRPELNDHWDVRIFLDLDFATVLQRGADRDQSWAGSWQDAAELYRSRYIPSEELYLAEVEPRRLADLVINMTDHDNPVVVER